MWRYLVTGHIYQIAIPQDSCDCRKDSYQAKTSNCLGIAGIVYSVSLSPILFNDTYQFDYDSAIRDLV